MNEPSGWIFLGLRFGLALSLYAFLTVTIVIVWKEMQQQAKSSIQKMIPPIELSIGNVEGEREIQQFSLSPIVIGRDPMCDYIVSNETVSSKHARVFFKKGQWWVEDLGSSNGTFLNEQPVEMKTVLTLGDRLRCGQIEIIVSI